MHVLKHHCPSEWMLLLLLLLHVLLWCPLPAGADTSRVAGVVDRACAARWSMLSSQRNHPGARDFQVRLGYTSGPKDLTPGDSQDQNNKDRQTLVGLTVRLAAAASADFDQQGVLPTELTVQMTGAELARSVERSVTVTVPERGAVTVWQLVVTTSGDAGDQRRRYGFENTAVTSGGLEPPSGVVACTASYRIRPLIREDTLVRLRHATTGMYMVMTRKRGWEAATLGHSREFRYRLSDVGVGTGSVRIEAETHTYGGYKYAYSSLRGGVYFDTWKLGSEAQQWTLSNPFPRDGDSVTIMSLRWPGAALIYNQGGKTANVYCLYTPNPDRWTLEMA